MHGSVATAHFTPNRTDRGQRRYGAAGVQRVLWLVPCVAQGQRIFNAVSAPCRTARKAWRPAILALPYSRLWVTAGPDTGRAATIPVWGLSLNNARAVAQRVGPPEKS